MCFWQVVQEMSTIVSIMVSTTVNFGAAMVGKIDSTNQFVAFTPPTLAWISFTALKTSWIAQQDKTVMEQHTHTECFCGFCFWSLMMAFGAIIDQSIWNATPIGWKSAIVRCRAHQADFFVSSSFGDHFMWSNLSSSGQKCLFPVWVCASRDAENALGGKLSVMWKNGNFTFETLALSMMETWELIFCFSLVGSTEFTMWGSTKVRNLLGIDHCGSSCSVFIIDTHWGSTNHSFSWNWGVTVGDHTPQRCGGISRNKAPHGAGVSVAL